MTLENPDKTIDVIRSAIFQAMLNTRSGDTFPQHEDAEHVENLLNQWGFAVVRTGIR